MEDEGDDCTDKAVGIVDTKPDLAPQNALIVRPCGASSGAVLYLIQAREQVDVWIEQGLVILAYIVARRPGRFGEALCYLVPILRGLL